MYRAFVLVLLYCALGTGVAAGQQAAPTSPRQDPAQQPPTPAGKQAAPAAPQEKLSDAERIARLQRTVDENEQRLNELKAKVDDPQGDYAKSEAEFATLDKDLEEKKKTLQKLQSEGRGDEATALQTEFDDLQKRRNLTKDRFDLAIKERKALQEQIVTLEQKLTQDRDILNKLKSPPSTQPALAPGQTPTTTPVPPPPAQPEGQAAPAATTAAPTATTTPPPADAGQAAPGAAPDAVKPPSKEVLDAQEEALAKDTEAKIAEEAVTDIAGRIEQLRSLIAKDRELLKNKRQTVEVEQETQRMLTEQVQKRSSEGAPQEELQPLWTKIAEARQRVRDARTEVAKYVDQIDRYQDDLDRLQADYIDALKEAEEKRAEADQAQHRLDVISNPFAPRNLLKWAVEHGPVVAGILLSMFALLWLARVAEKRIIRILVGPATGHEAAERENRAKTLVSVFHNAANLLVIVGGIFMILDEVSVPIAPLLGGAAVMGLAVAFGAQNLVRDYFSGFMILLENQYDINDVIKVGDVGGLVERITLRVTVLRGLDGTVHFIPNGQIEKVSNMTHGWSRALFDIGVAYKEDVDQVMKVLVDLGKELRSDQTFRQLILDDPEMLGVDSFDDSAVVIKFFIKTRPLQQWTVKRAMLRRIKKKFDELGIEIPFPHRTVFVHHESGEAPSPQPPVTSTPVE